MNVVVTTIDGQDFIQYSEPLQLDTPHLATTTSGGDNGDDNNHESRLNKSESYISAWNSSLLRFIENSINIFLKFS